MFQVLISVRLSKPQGLVRPEGLGKFKILPRRVSMLLCRNKITESPSAAAYSHGPVSREVRLGRSKFQAEIDGTG
jgi:hypothetical protein